MPLEIDSDSVEKMGGRDALVAEVATFRDALKNHAKTINVPAPTASPLVEGIVKAGGFVVIELETNLPADDPNSLQTQITELAARLDKIEAVRLPAPRQVAVSEG
jgi:hypothetical protein